VWDAELDLVQFFNFATGCDDSDDVARQSAAAGDADATAAERFHVLTTVLITPWGALQQRPSTNCKIIGGASHRS